MFFDANITHFTVYIDGLNSDQNNNTPLDKLTSKASASSPNSPLGGGINPSSADGESEALLGVGDKLTSIKNNLTGLSAGLSGIDPFSTLEKANKIKASVDNLKSGFSVTNFSDKDNQAQPRRAIDRLQVLSFQVVEGISSPYAAQVELINEHVRFDITQLLSKSIFLAFTPGGKAGPGIHGIIQQVKRGAIDSHHARFTIVITPRFTNLMRRVNQRKFVGKTTPEIIKVILEEHGIVEGADTGFEFKFKDTAAYTARDFCVQYDESDYHFVSRLCEEEGISYSFTHSANAHKMTFSDAMPFFPSIKDAVQFMSDSGMNSDTQVIKYFDVSLASRPQTASWRDYNFTNMKIPEGTSKGLQSEKANQANEPNLEFYDYPSRGMNKARNDQLAKIQIERLRADHLQAEAYSDIPKLHSGNFISLKDHPEIDPLNGDKPWLITQIIHKGYQPQVLTYLAGGDSAKSTTTTNNATTNLLTNYLDQNTDRELDFPVADQAQGYYNVFNAIPRDVPYRPNKKHLKAKVLGSQTAIVTGIAGEEIYCDEYGRVKVQFHWDREGIYDENSSHWIRVASNWAHDSYGTIVIPRVGMEVKIDFLEGDPDNPIITGAIHNGKNKVPYELPANKTRSVFKTSSSKGGIGSNELRIEDKAGQEQIFVQAQKDFDQLTKHNHTVQVNNNSHLQVQNEHSETIIGNRYQKQQSEEHHLTQLDRKTQIMMNDYKTVAVAEHTTIGTVQTIQAGQEIHLKAGMNLVIDGGLSLTLKAGGQHIILNPAGIFTTPIFTGGIPMEGTPAAPLLPLNKEKTVAPSLGPILGSGIPFVQMCQKPQGGSPADCPLSNCPCRAKQQG